MLPSDFVEWDTRIADLSGLDVTFTVLGQLRMVSADKDVAPTTPKLLQVLAVLLTRPGQVVQTETIQRELWRDRLPRSAQPTLQTYIYQLRSLFRQAGLTGQPDRLLVTRRLGYVLRIEPWQVDVHRFQQLCRDGRMLMADCRFGEAAARLRSALDLWSGPPLANVQHGPVLSAYTIDLQEQRRNAQILRIQAEVESGQHRELIGELRSLADTNPLDESVYAQLIRVLDRSGRRGDALHAYRRLRTHLNEELGLEPGAELQRLHQHLIDS
ncbi:AfsR/SARP family transcriptional regulator [Kibdelosporangium persicum]|uniref:Transcriptional regulatory protein EmbR n=1 Tax=Kibdelosporangium persicum TaxID=2698649 RepID=A0ABX2EWM2_9PSEU|nr:AfsR/SARP family transcriptional regulator [Kibdelosporangium persicum]NRN63215.1 Transcriptional regulatory protein EmbR [Kibdelosporangium persicum]